MGAESGSQRVLDAMEKGVRVEQIVEATRRLHDQDIEVGFFLQFGYPGETRDDITRTFDLVRTCEPDDIGVSVSYPLPGTRFHDRVEASLGSTRNWVDSGDLAMLYRGPFTTAFYRQLHRVLHREFRARKTWRRLRGQAARGKRPAAFDRRCIPPGGVAPQSNTTGILPRRALPRGRITGLSATLDVLRGLLGRAMPTRSRVGVRQTLSLLRSVATLPYARWRLDRLARVPNLSLGPLPYELTPRSAAHPAPQPAPGSGPETAVSRPMVAGQ